MDGDSIVIDKDKGFTLKRPQDTPAARALLQALMSGRIEGGDDMNLSTFLPKILAGKASNRIKAERIVAQLGRRIADETLLMYTIEMILDYQQAASRPRRCGQRAVLRRRDARLGDLGCAAGKDDGAG